MSWLQTRWRDQYTFDHLFNQNAHKALFPLMALAGITDKDCVILLSGGIFNATGDLGKEWIRNVRDN